MKNKSLFSVLIIIFTMCIISQALAKFGVGGKSLIDINTNDVANSVAMQPDGKLVVAGTSNDDIVLVRLKTNGEVDTSFGTNGRVVTDINNGSIDCGSCMIVQPDGKLVVVGSCSKGGNADFAIVRYTSTGFLDTSFSGGKVITPIGSSSEQAYGLTLQPDGKLIAVGYCHNGSTDDIAVVRYNSNGSLDTTFNGTGKVTTGIAVNEYATNVITQPDGKILVVGFSHDGYTQNFVAVRYNSTGSLDTTYSNDGIVTKQTGGPYSWVYGLALQPDGKMVAVEWYNTNGSDDNLALVRYDTAGNLDTSFDSDGIVITAFNSTRSQAHGVIIQPDGKVVVAGSSYNNGNWDFALARYESNGGPDSSFGVNGVTITAIGNAADYANSLLMQPDGKFIVTGYSITGSNRDLAVVRYNNNGSIDTMDSPPQLTELKTTHGLAGETIDLDVRGFNFEGVAYVQLRRDKIDYGNASISNVTNTRILAQLPLPAAGTYDLYLAKDSTNQTFKSIFTVQNPVTLPMQWIVSDLGTTGTPVSTTCGLAIGDGDGDGSNEIYLASGDVCLYQYKKTTGWSTLRLPVDNSAHFQDVCLADMDLDGICEVYGSNTYPRVFKYLRNGVNWEGNSFCGSGGSLVQGNLIGNTLVNFYAQQSDLRLLQSSRFNSSWANSPIGILPGTVLSGVVGDVNNDGINELCVSASDNHVYQFSYTTSCSQAVSVGAFSNSINTLALAELDKDGIEELYAACGDGKIYTHKWNSGSWQPINSTALVANKLVVSDADNDGQDELYAASQDGHVYQLKLTGAVWSITDLVVHAPSPLVAMAIGDGDNSHQLKIYALDSNKHLYEFAATTIPPTATPTATVTSTPTQTPLPSATMTVTPTQTVYLTPASTSTITPTCTPTPTVTLTVTITPTVTVTPTPANTPIPDAEKHLRIWHSQINPNHNERAKIRWYQNDSSPVQIKVYNQLGNEIITLADGQGFVPDRINEILWDGKNQHGAKVGSGIYLVYYSSGGHKEWTKVAVVK